VVSAAEVQFFSHLQFQGTLTLPHYHDTNTAVFGLLSLQQDFVTTRGEMDGFVDEQLHVTVDVHDVVVGLFFDVGSFGLFLGDDYAHEAGFVLGGVESALEQVLNVCFEMGEDLFGLPIGDVGHDCYNEADFMGLVLFIACVFGEQTVDELEFVLYYLEG
jgi:hypothetical protein